MTKKVIQLPVSWTTCKVLILLYTGHQHDVKVYMYASSKITELDKEEEKKCLPLKPLQVFPSIKQTFFYCSMLCYIDL